MPLPAGNLRHRVNIEERVETQNSQTGAMETTWRLVLRDEPADIQPLSVKDFIAAQATQSQITARIVLRWRPEFHPQMRIIHGAKVYWPAGFLPDKKYGNEYVTAPCHEGVDRT